MKKLDLLEQFEKMQKMPIIEINKADYIGGDDDYEIYNITADIKGLYTGSFFVEWDVVFSLDEHLQALMELIIQDL